MSLMSKIIYSINDVCMSNSGTCGQFNYSLSELAKCQIERNVHS